MRKKDKTEKPLAYVGRRFIGIRQAAATLGVSENHLRMCLNKKRESRSLMARVRTLFPELVKGAA